MSDEYTFSPFYPHSSLIESLKAERDKAIAERDEWYGLAVKAMDELVAAKEALSRLDVNYSPTGRIESLEARITALEALVKSR